MSVYTVNEQGILVNEAGERVTGEPWRTWQQEQVAARNNADAKRKQVGRRVGHTYSTDEDGNISEVRTVADGFVASGDFSGAVLTGDALVTAMSAAQATDKEKADAAYAADRLRAAHNRLPVPGRIAAGEVDADADLLLPVGKRSEAAMKVRLNEAHEHAVELGFRPAGERDREYFPYGG